MSVYAKAFRVIKSCDNLEQIFVAQTWLELMHKLQMKSSRTADRWQVTHANRELHNMLNERRDAIYAKLLN